MTLPLAGRTALVTGASRGIGAAVARALASAGARVALVSRSQAALEAVAATLPHAPVVIADDLLQPIAATTVAAAATEAFGATPDIVVLAAGTFPLGPVDAIAEDELETAFGLNAIAPLRLVRAFLPAMRARDTGHVVFLGSLADRHVFPSNAVYAATKHALRATAEAVRAESRGSGVRCTLVSPAATDTPIWDPHDPDAQAHLPNRDEMLRPEDVADAVLWSVTRPPAVNLDEIRLSRS
ncbi:SDR family NAD(P)-dependent oxidoreductase [Pseudogemmatithrix spongiicola]|uniref:SDR family NAD(P)-dependent oxidoreductase n=1 Tax=Pseudogemmatithrix spongiicola TaxID=3062599 RepID=A0AA49JSV0_9BACT|nr:SDR family NAD(P)-dependent oxidoreductase [Gemmatimonadaceae bacterium 'strain 138']WKW14241.1 SDR family NAD(P)-dependent oxidoreductase [Gemmatimonadaceae bacterium 'strain 318']